MTGEEKLMAWIADLFFPSPSLA